MRFTTLITVLFLLSCSNSYNDYQSIDDLKWGKDDVKIFQINIKESGYYDMFFTFRHITGYPFKQIKIEITQITPKKKEYIIQKEISVADENNKYIGEVTGQLWDVEGLISENTYLEKGSYTFQISHIMNTNPVILVVDVGLVIRETKKN